MSMFIKICGITSPEAARAAASAGADALGFVFADSPRRVTPSEAEELARHAPASVEKIAVFLDPSPQEVDEVLDGFRADAVQANAGSLRGFDTLPLLPVARRAEDVPSSGRFLYEGERSGAGELADWPQASELATTGRLILAGGLDAHNVADAVRIVRPYGVDVSSGVETSPGRKSPQLILEFVEAVRYADKEMMRS